MRILSVTESYAPFFEFGGPPVKVGSLARGLAARGHEVTVLTADWGFEERSNAAELASAERSALGWRASKGGVTAVYLPTWLRRRAVTWNPAVKRFCRERLKDFDVAHIFGLYDLLGPAVAAGCVKRNILYVVEPIGMFVPIVRSLWLKRIYHALYGKRLFEKASAIVATSDQEVAELTSGGVAREKILLRRNGVERPASWPERRLFRQRYQIAEKDKVVLFLGRLSEKKSPDLLLRAFASLPQNAAGCTSTLVYAGPDEGGMKARLEEMAAALGVSRRVRFTGPIFGEEKWAAYRDADVFVLPSKNENFGNTAAESAAAGTPVVVTEQCGVAPLIANVAGVVAPHQTEAVAQAIQQILCDPSVRDRFVAGCSEVTSRLDWEQPVAKMERMYDEMRAKRFRDLGSGLSACP